MYSAGIRRPAPSLVASCTARLSDASVLSDQEPGPLRWAAVEAGKMAVAFVRDADRTVMPLSSWIRMVLGTTDRNCRLLP